MEDSGPVEARDEARRTVRIGEAPATESQLA
jgi:hypothetical protein